MAASLSKYVLKRAGVCVLVIGRTSGIGFGMAEASRPKWHVVRYYLVLLIFKDI